MKAADDDRRPTAGTRRLMLVAPVLVMLIPGALFYAGSSSRDAVAPPTPVGGTVPEFALPPIAGRQQGLASPDLRGEVSIVNFWASWCAPCRAEMPLLMELADAGSVAVYGVNTRDDPGAAGRFLAETGDPYRRVGADADGRLSVAWGIYGLPATFVIDGRGNIADRLVGPLDRQNLDERILPLVLRLKAEAGDH